MTDRSALERALAEDGLGTLVVVRIDDLAGIERALGTGAAQQVAAIVGHRSRAVLRPCDLLARLDDDRFVALVRPRPPVGALAVAEALAVAAAQPAHLDDGTPLPTLGLSIGIAPLDPTADAGPILDRVLAAVDEADHTDRTEGTDGLVVVV